MPDGEIRVMALCAIWRGDAILVQAPRNQARFTSA